MINSTTAITIEILFEIFRFAVSSLFGKALEQRELDKFPKQ